MKMHVAQVRDGSLEFAVVVVRPSLMSGTTRERDGAVEALSDQLGVPAVLMIRNSRGVPTFYGRPDLVESLACRCLEELSWRELTTRAA
jgi:hypothetical protein